MFASPHQYICQFYLRAGLSDPILELGGTAASVLISIPTFIEGISKQLAPMFVLFAFDGLLSHLVSLGERKSQALTADRGLN
jgi:hypothetical protein